MFDRFYRAGHHFTRIVTPSFPLCTAGTRNKTENMIGPLVMLFHFVSKRHDGTRVAGRYGSVIIAISAA